MKRAIILLAVAVLAAFGPASCAPGDAPDGASDGRIRIVTTIFPAFDWVRNILGRNPAGIETEMLLDNGVDIHSYQPTVDDILQISTCDIFIYVGGEGDRWVDDALKKAANPDMEVVNLLDVLGDAAKEEEIKEGMQGERGEEEEGAGAAGESNSADEPPEYDEHVWLSLRNASALVEEIAEAVAKADPANARLYQDNADAYQTKLSELDKEYRDAVAGARVKTFLFGDRFPFRYLADDYGIDYYAAFAGCSAETGASFETIVFLAKKADELSLNTILTTEGADRALAQTIRSCTKSGAQKILEMDSMQSVTARDVKDGADYLAIMEQNLDTLREALGSAPPTKTAGSAPPTA